MAADAKANALVRDIISVYHPDAKGDFNNFMLKYSRHIKTTAMVEECMAYIGGYNFVDGDHYDFDDGKKLRCPNTDCKTASISARASARGGYPLAITGVRRTSSGAEKEGALRVVLYNPNTDSNLYYFIPKSAWANMTPNDPSIKGFWNHETNSIPMLDKFRVRDFKVLAQRPANFEL